MPSAVSPFTPGSGRALTVMERLPVPTSTAAFTESLTGTGRLVAPGRFPSSPIVDWAPVGVPGTAVGANA